MIGLAGETAQPPVTPTMKRRQPLVNIASPNIGDTVKLPDGQLGILRYVGPITGKPGEFAGIELIQEWASQGRHNGEFNG